MNQQQLETDDLVESVTESSAEQSKLREAYVKERTYLEVVEIELNRSKIIMIIDEQGRKKRVPFCSNTSQHWLYSSVLRRSNQK